MVESESRRKSDRGAGSVAGEDRIDHLLDRQSVVEAGLRVGPGRDGIDQVTDLVHEGGVPADDMPRRVPVPQVGVGGLGRQDRRKPASRAGSVAS